tara:strand:+ start:689 stop:1105 length:417 start_codon:yes stop_codon:yes gene_type:complete
MNIETITDDIVLNSDGIPDSPFYVVERFDKIDKDNDLYELAQRLVKAGVKVGDEPVTVANIFTCKDEDQARSLAEYLVVYYRTSAFITNRKPHKKELFPANIKTEKNQPIYYIGWKNNEWEDEEGKHLLFMRSIEGGE